MSQWPPITDTDNIDIRQLENGLTLVMAPSAVKGTAVVAVHVRVGFRSEPHSYAGLAHLLEHLMFQDSHTGGPGDHMARVERLGGIAGARTRHDYTEFFDVVPRSALTVAIGLEIERLSDAVFTDAGIRTQVAVIEAEIMEETVGKPYGGFPWTSLPSVMFSDWANVHNGYGDVFQLADTTDEQVDSFFRAAYSPANIVVTVTADDFTAHELDVLTTGFGTLRAGPGLRSEVSVEAPLNEDRHRTSVHPNSPVPLTAAGLRLPNPSTRPDLYRGCAALPALLRLEGGLGGPEARCGWFGRPLDTLHQDAWIVTASATAGSPGEMLAAGLRGTLERWSKQPYPSEFLDLLTSRIQLDHHNLSQEVAYRARRLGATISLYGDLGLLRRAAPESGVTELEIRRASEFLLAQSIATLTVAGAL